MRKIMKFYTCSIMLLTWGVTLAHATNGDVEYGEYLSSECVSCHLKSDDAQGIPPIIGLDEASFMVLMQAYRTKERENPTMQTIAGALDDEQLAALAAYFSTLSKD